MRKILFRGKSLETDEWIYGDIFRSSLKSPFVFIHDLKNHLNVVVDPETVGQYTGLKDKDGNKIFEGDILSIAQKSDGVGRYFDPPIKYPANVVVKWDLCAWMWEVIGQEKYYLSFPDAWCHYECEIIGNIYDNPELIGGDE